jgi:hypothetical protein
MKKRTVRIVIVMLLVVVFGIYSFSPTRQVNASAWKLAPIGAKNITFYHGIIMAQGVCDCDELSLQQWKSSHHFINGSVPTVLTEKIQSDLRCGYSSVSLISNYPEDEIPDNASAGFRIITKGESGHTPGIETGGIMYIYDKNNQTLYISWTTN